MKTAVKQFQQSGAVTNDHLAFNGSAWVPRSQGVFSDVILTEEAAPAVSASGKAKVYADSTSHRTLLSQNGGAYFNILTAADVGGSSTEFLYNNAGAIAGVTGWTYNSTSKAVAYAPAAVAAGTPTMFTLTAAANTNQSTTGSALDFVFDGSAIQQHATGSNTLQRMMRIAPRTYSAIGASVITDAAAVDIEGSPLAGTNVTIGVVGAPAQGSVALRVSGGTTANTGSVITGYALRAIQGTNATAPSNANNGNLAARFDGRVVIRPEAQDGQTISQMSRQFMWQQTGAFTKIGGASPVAAGEVMYAFMNFNNSTNQFNFNAGTLTTQRTFVLTPPNWTNNGAAALVLTDGVFMEINGPPGGGTNTTITNAIGLRITGRSLSGLGVTTSIGLQVQANTNATTNIALDATAGTSRISNGANAVDILQVRNNTTNVTLWRSGGSVLFTPVVAGLADDWVAIGTGSTVAQTGKRALFVNAGTPTATGSDQSGVEFNILPGTATSSTTMHSALRISVNSNTSTSYGNPTSTNAGGGTFGIRVDNNTVLGTGVNPFTGTYPGTGTFGAHFGAGGAGSLLTAGIPGYVIGAVGRAYGSATATWGLFGLALNTNGNTGPTTGVMALGSAGNTSAQHGLIATVGFQDPGQSGGIDLTTSAVIIADNNTSTGTPLFLARTTSVTVFNIAGKGDVYLTPVVQTSGAARTLTVTAAAHTGQNSGQELPDVYFGLDRTVTFAAGAITTQRAFTITAPTYNAGAFAITNAATFAIAGAPVAAGSTTLTNSYALWVQAGKTQLDGLLKVTGDMTLAPTAQAGGAHTTLLVTGPAHTAQATVTEIVDVDFNLSATLTHAAGGGSTQRSIVMRPRTHAFTSGSNQIADAATLAVAGPPIAGANCSGFLRTPSALWVQSGQSRFDDAVVITTGAGRTLTVESGLSTLAGGMDTVDGLLNVGGLVTIHRTSSATGDPDPDTADTPIIFSNTDSSVGTTVSLFWLHADTEAAPSRDGMVSYTKRTGSGDAAIEFRLALISNSAFVADKFTFNVGTGDFTAVGALAASSANITGPVTILPTTAFDTGAGFGYVSLAAGHPTLTATPFTASVPCFDTVFGSVAGAAELKHATGALAFQYTNYFLNRKYSFAGSSALTIAATVAIHGAPIAHTSAVVTASIGLYIEGETDVTDAGTVADSYGLYCVASAGATRNHAARFVGHVIASTLVVNGNTAAPDSTFKVSGSAAFSAGTTSVDLTLDDTNHTVLVNASTGNRVMTLPASASCINRRFEIKKTDNTANTVTITPDGSETIDGAATFVLNTQYQSVTIVNNGFNWFVV